MVNAKITKNFNDNIEYLQSHQKELFSKLAALDSAIELGHYQERYDLVYENDYFDVYEKETEQYLYTKNSYTHARLAAKSIDYSLDDSVFKTFNTKDIDSYNLQKYADDDSFKDVMSGFAPILNYVQEHSQKEKLLKTLDKFIFFGVGLGFHISDIDKRISSKVYFIVEDDLELFRLSLFTTNYKEIASDSKLIFSIFEDKDEFVTSAKVFLDEEYYYNHYIKYFHMLSHSEDKHEQFHMLVASQAHLSFDYNVYLTQGLKPLEYIFDDYIFLDKNLTFSDRKLDEEKFLLLAAGPSLQKNIGWLKKNQEKFIIVAVAAVLVFLEEEGIVPDIVIHLDAYETSIELFKNVKSMEFIKDSILFFSDKTASNVLELFDKQRVFLFENGTNYKIDSMKPSAPCVGSISYQILLILKVKNIYLLGLDLAIDSKTGKTHIDSYVDVKKLSIEDQSSKNDILGYSESLFKIEGNLTPEVYTNPRWKTSIDIINLATRLLKQENQNILNLSNGVKFVDIEAKKSNNINNIKKDKKINQYIFDKCIDNSSKNLNKDEIDDLNKKLLHAKKLLEIVKIFKAKTDVSALENIIELNKVILDSGEVEKYQLNQVLDIYLKNILSYIFDFINSKNIKNQDTHLNILYIFLTEHIIKIIGYYADSISEKLEQI